MEINKVICMDNLEFMKSLPDESIDLLYSDILYGTGKKFKDYQDLKPIKTVIYEFYEPRIKEMHRLLKPTGSIYLQMDYRIVHWVRCILDDTFGYENFINEIIWYYKSPSGTVKTKLTNKHDNILLYSKTGKYTLNIDEIREEYAENTRKQAQNKNISFGRETKLNEKGKTPTDVWEIPTLNSQAKERVDYDTQKPLELMDKIIKASSNECELLADFFMGSGSFVVRAKELNRKFIGCDINPRAIEIANSRLIS